MIWYIIFFSNEYGPKNDMRSMQERDCIRILIKRTITGKFELQSLIYLLTPRYVVIFPGTYIEIELG